MERQALIREVISQTSQNFTPKVPDIEREIDILLEQEYIKRVEELAMGIFYLLILYLVLWFILMFLLYELVGEIRTSHRVIVQTITALMYLPVLSKKKEGDIFAYIA